MLKNKYIYVKINGKQYKVFCFQKITIYHLIMFFNYKLNLIAVEYNGVIIPENLYKLTSPINNSNIEIVTIVGGG